MGTEKERERKNKYIEWKEDKKLDENSIDLLVHENKRNERKIKKKDGQKN